MPGFTKTCFSGLLMLFQCLLALLPLLAEATPAENRRPPDHLVWLTATNEATLQTDFSSEACQGLYTNHGFVVAGACFRKLHPLLRKRGYLAAYNADKIPLLLTRTYSPTRLGDTGTLLVQPSKGSEYEPVAKPAVDLEAVPLSSGQLLEVMGPSGPVVFWMLAEGRYSTGIERENILLEPGLPVGSVVSSQDRPVCVVVNNRGKCTPVASISRALQQLTHKECPRLNYIACNHTVIDPSSCDGKGNGHGLCTHNNERCYVFIDSDSLMSLYEQVTCGVCNTIYERTADGTLSLGYFHTNSSLTPREDLPPPPCFAPLTSKPQ